MNEAKKSVFSIKLKWKSLFLVHWVSGSLPQRLNHGPWVANIGGVLCGAAALGGAANMDAVGQVLRAT